VHARQTHGSIHGVLLSALLNHATHAIFISVPTSRPSQRWPGIDIGAFRVAATNALAARAMGRAVLA
jgi:hypothetical protein